MNTIELVAAKRSDIDMLTALRVEVLLAANKLPPETDMEQVARETKQYYEKCLGNGAHIEYLAYMQGRLAGCGAACLYTVMPTYNNPTGRKAYIMNMYTRPAFRRRGIARTVLHKLVQEVVGAGVTLLALEATEGGRPLYESEGFLQAGEEMQLDLRFQTRD